MLWTGSFWFFFLFFLDYTELLIADSDCNKSSGVTGHLYSEDSLGDQTIVANPKHSPDPWRRVKSTLTNQTRRRPRIHTETFYFKNPGELSR